MKVDATLNVNGIAYPVEFDPHLTLLRRYPPKIAVSWRILHSGCMIRRETPISAASP